MIKRKLRAMAYLAKVNKNYKLDRLGRHLLLKHYGKYGWCSGGSYYDWKIIEMVDFFNETEYLESDDGNIEN